MVFICWINLLINWQKYRYFHQNLSPLILRARSISLLMTVTLCACAEQRLASSNRDTMAASVASCKACKAALWNLYSVSKFNSLSIWRTKFNAKSTFTVEGGFLHKELGRALVAFYLPQCSFTWSGSSFLLNACFDGGAFPCDLLRSQFLFLVTDLLGGLLGCFRASHVPLL